MYNLTVDGITFNIACSIKRTAKITDSEVSGMLLNRRIHRDIIATYMQYEVAMAVPKGSEDEYYDLYDILVDPVAFHTFILPYNNGTIQIEAAVNEVKDTYFGEEGDYSLWRKISFTITQIDPLLEPENDY